MINQDFVDLINSGEAWAFVGSGASIDARLLSWSAATGVLPDRLGDSGLRDRLVSDERWGRARKSDDYPAALQLAEDICGRDRLLASFEAALGTPAGRGDVYRVIARWPFRNFVTTNYDRLLLEAVKELEPTAQAVENSPEGLRLMTREPKALVLRLHGSLRPGTTTVLTKRDYDRAYGPGGEIGSMALQLLKDRRFIIVGFGFNDPDVLRILRLAAGASNPARPHFAVLGFEKEDQRNARDLAAEYRVVVIPYRIAGDGSHADLRRVLGAYDWCILSKTTRRVLPDQKPKPQSSAVAALHLANECLAAGDPNQPEIRRILRTLCLCLLREAGRDLQTLCVAIPERLPIQKPAAQTLRSLLTEELNTLISEGPTCQHA